jgi:hypothetical protein
MNTVNTPTKYLVTDPCYIMQGDIYQRFLDLTDGEFEDGDNPFVIPGFGKIVKSIHCAEVDVKVGKKADGTVKQILSDTALVCLVELEPGVEPTDYQGTAVTAKREVADKWLAKCEQWGSY